MKHIQTFNQLFVRARVLSQSILMCGYMLLQPML